LGNDEMKSKMSKSLRTTDCDFCSKNHFKILRRSPGTNNAQFVYSSSSNAPLSSQLVKCLDCHLVSVNPRREQKFLETAYGNAVDTIHGSNSDLRVKSFKRALKWANRAVRELDPNECPILVDIGCASGEFPKAASDFGYSVTGFEPSVYLSELGRQKFQLDIRTGIFDPSMFPSNTVDVVTMWDVLEHLESPDKMLQSLLPVLKSEGFLILNLPMIDTFTAKLMGRWWPFYLEVHLFYFTRRTIRQYLEKHGFKVMAINSYSQTLGLRYLVTRASAGRFTSFPLNLPLRYRLGQRTIVAQKIRCSE